MGINMFCYVQYLQQKACNHGLYFMASEICKRFSWFILHLNWIKVCLTQKYTLCVIINFICNENLLYYVCLIHKISKTKNLNEWQTKVKKKWNMAKISFITLLFKHSMMYTTTISFPLPYACSFFSIILIPLKAKPTSYCCSKLFRYLYMNILVYTTRNKKTKFCTSHGRINKFQIFTRCNSIIVVPTQS